MKIKTKTNLRALVLAVLATTACLNARAVELGQTAPEFTLPTLNQAETKTLKQFAGKVVYLDFWASWCAPCRTSFPLLNKLHEQLQAKGFEVVAVNLDEDAAKAEKFLKEIPVGFTVLRDASGQISDQFVVESMPTSFILDRKGVVQKIHHGFNSGDIKEIEEKVTALLNEK